MADVTMLPAAEADYQAALAWYVSRSVRAAVRFEAALDAGLRAIRDNPELWPQCDDRHRFYSLRRFPYALIYRIRPSDIVVVAVAHTKRHSSFWQGRNGT